MDHSAQKMMTHRIR